jgi:hypothetical protein
MGDILKSSGAASDLQDQSTGLKPSQGLSDEIDDTESLSFVSSLYRAVFRRKADSEGLRYWVTQLANGMRKSEIVERFVSSDEYNREGIKLYSPVGSFYSPIVNPLEAAKFLAATCSLGTPESLPGIDIDRTAMITMWRDLLPFMLDAPFHKTNGASGLRYRFDNPGYSWGDGSVLHAMIRRYRPARIIEIGSGWSSGCTVDTVERCLDGKCELTFIDPYPKLLHEVLGSDQPKATIRIVEARVQDVPVSDFDQLRERDILFIDSTHVLRTGSDVCYELFEILPRLASGVVVHIHDMFWPFEYPYDWVVRENRSWNEIYAIRALLSENQRWRILFFNDYLAKLEHEMVAQTYPDFLRNAGGALWIEKR